MMRKTLSCCCLALSVMVGIFLDFVAYLITAGRIDTKLAMLVFVPFFIVMYWLGTFFDQLIVKDKKPIFSKRISKLLRAVYTVSLLSVCAVWMWVIYRYTYFFGELIGEIKGRFG